MAGSAKAVRPSELCISGSSTDDSMGKTLDAGELSYIGTRILAVAPRFTSAGPANLPASLDGTRNLPRN